MQSSYSIIKSPNVDFKGDTLIDTEYEIPEEEEKAEEKKFQVKLPDFKKSYEKIGANILESARSQARDIIDDAKNKGTKLQKEAYDFGYDEGHKKGYDEGIKKALDEMEEKKQELMEESEKIIYACKEQYQNYLKEKEKDIINMILEISYKYLRKEIENEDVITSMVKDELEKIHNADTIVLKFNPKYYDEIKKNLDAWKKAYSLREVFLIPDESLELGTVVIEKEKGKCKLSLNYALDKIKDELLK
ncbi:FliH/SctL family protein [Hathewaya limosa]|uniref:Flagellar assembly protein FliH n=1 Tax=Hathewaya limosa TaxID=1536 RepID=A0ABU0JQ90_HATLI|nr:FliH/SctL family protein [Hathewaya limosa]MDQ0479257.1 flagellar assembly protein FliH [Hathewaya limosa]